MAWLGLLAAWPQVATAGEVAGDSKAIELDRVTVTGRRRSLVGEAVSASEGTIGQADIAERPLLRTGDLLEFVPGLVATQHSGSGKANQYFLRGFNLDHGTDFATFVDGMPVNMRTHGHGQGWTDLNFLIPETVESLTYRKGPYYADVGDFSAAGSARFDISDRVDGGTAELTLGSFGYGRALLIDSARAAGGDVLYAAELQAYDGPWTDIDEDVRKGSALVRYSADKAGGRAHVMLMGYSNSWNSPDQIPRRAVSGGLISSLGSIDPTVGGASSRFSLSAGWAGAAFGGDFRADAYAISSRLDLWSNFTYFLDDPVNGDQFQQVDDRTVYGFNLSQQWTSGRSKWRVGGEGRLDDIARVALLHTRGRALVGSIRDDAVREGSVGLFVANEFQLSDRWRTYVGARRDQYAFRVNSSLDENSGRVRAGRTSLKASLAYRATDALELYASAGTGFHSNDARGTTIRVDPATREPVDRVDPLVPSLGGELGARLFLSNRVQATAAVWGLRLDSELLFVGDAGTTEPNRPSQREGVEAGVSWFASERYSANIEASYSQARFRDREPAGDHVPGSIPLVIGAGLVARYGDGWTASVQLKHFGRYPLIEDASVLSDGSTLLNLRLARQVGRFGVNLEVLNVLDSHDHDVDYLYASRLPGEPDEGVEDVHFHAFPSRGVRVGMRYSF